LGIWPLAILYVDTGQKHCCVVHFLYFDTIAATSKVMADEEKANKTETSASAASVKDTSETVLTGKM